MYLLADRQVIRSKQTGPAKLERKNSWSGGFIAGKQSNCLHTDDQMKKQHTGRQEETNYHCRDDIGGIIEKRE